MQGVRFYLEFPSPSAKKRSGKFHSGHSGNVFAAFTEYAQAGQCEGIGSVFADPNSPVAGTSASRGYLARECKRIPERIAREIHPRLFERLDNDNKQEQL